MDTHTQGSEGPTIAYLVPVHGQPFFQQPKQYPAVYEVPVNWQQVLALQPMYRGEEEWEGGYRQFFPLPLPIPIPPIIISPLYHPPYPPFPVIQPFPPFY